MKKIELKAYCCIVPGSRVSDFIDGEFQSGFPSPDEIAELVSAEGYLGCFYTNVDRTGIKTLMDNSDNNIQDNIFLATHFSLLKDDAATIKRLIKLNLEVKFIDFPMISRKELLESATNGNLVKSAGPGRPRQQLKANIADTQPNKPQARSMKHKSLVENQHLIGQLMEMIRSGDTFHQAAEVFNKKFSGSGRYYPKSLRRIYESVWNFNEVFNIEKKKAPQLDIALSADEKRGINFTYTNEKGNTLIIEGDYQVRRERIDLEVNQSQGFSTYSLALHYYRSNQNSELRKSDRLFFHSKSPVKVPYFTIDLNALSILPGLYEIYIGEGKDPEINGKAYHVELQTHLIAVTT